MARLLYRIWVWGTKMGNGFLINAEQTRKQYTPTAGVVEFAIPWEFFDNDDIEVYFDDNTTPESSGLTVAGERDSTPGNRHVTFAVAPYANSVALLTIVLNMTIERTTAFSTSSDWQASSVDDEFDRQILICKQLDEKSGRYLSYPVAIADAVSAVLPNPATYPGQTLAFAADGLSIETVAVRGGMVRATNTSSFDVTNAQTRASPHVVALATEDHDVKGEWATPTFVADTDGIYSICVGVRDSTGGPSVPGDKFTLKVKLTSATFPDDTIETPIISSAQGYAGAHLSATIPLEAGDSFQIDMFERDGAVNSSSWRVPAGYLRLTVTKISALPAGL